MRRTLFGQFILGGSAKTLLPPPSHLLAKTALLSSNTSTSKEGQNPHPETEELINKQINVEMVASYLYLSLSAFCARDSVALLGFSKRFLDLSHKERGHAEKLINYQNMRGSRVIFSDVAAPGTFEEWGTILEAMQATGKMEKKVNQSLLDIHKAASDKNDEDFKDFLEEHFIDEQVKSIREVNDIIINMKRAGPGLGTCIIDQQLLKAHSQHMVL